MKKKINKYKKNDRRQHGLFKIDFSKLNARNIIPIDNNFEEEEEEKRKRGKKGEGSFWSFKISLKGIVITEGVDA